MRDGSRSIVTGTYLIRGKINLLIAMLQSLKQNCGVRSWYSAYRHCHYPPIRDVICRKLVRLSKEPVPRVTRLTWHLICMLRFHPRDNASETKSSTDALKEACSSQQAKENGPRAQGIVAGQDAMETIFPLLQGLICCAKDRHLVGEMVVVSLGGIDQ